MNRYISFLHIWGILSVVVGHTFYNGYGVHVYAWIFSFQLTVIFFASGWLMCHGLRKGGRTVADVSLRPTDAFWVKKAKRLLVPYVILNTLIYLPKAALAGYTMRTYEASLGNYLHVMTHPLEAPNGAYWFMPALFLTFVLFVLVAKAFHFVPRRAQWPVALLGVAVALWFYYYAQINVLARVAYYTIFFAAGYWTCSQDYLQRPVRHDVPLFVGSFVALTCGVWYAYDYGYYYFFLYSLAGTLMSIALASIYVRRDWHVLDRLQGSNMIIYLYHVYVQSAIWAAYRWAGAPGEPYDLLHRAVAAVLGVAVPYLMYRFMQRHRQHWAVRVLLFISGERV